MRIVAAKSGSSYSVFKQPQPYKANGMPTAEANRSGLQRVAYYLVYQEVMISSRRRLLPLPVSAEARIWVLTIAFCITPKKNLLSPRPFEQLMIRFETLVKYVISVVRPELQIII